MFRIFAGVLMASLVALSPAQAEDRSRLGYGRMFTNDYFGDGKDRWRTGSISSSRVWGPTWQGQVPQGFGELIELRLSAEVLAPDNLETPDVGDRPYAGSITIGAHTHFGWNGFDMSTGADLVLTGSGTGLGSLQREFHELFGMQVPSDEVLDNQISGIDPTLVVEMARTLDLSDQVTLRPFLEGRAGAETFVRAGFDLTLGNIGQGELLIRENTTGQRYRVIQNSDNGGFSFVVGADMAQVAKSIYLPEDQGFDLTGSRDRVRAGVHWQGDSASAFYGLTWLGKEFEGQDDDQVVGSIRVNFRF
ncbi:DUF2219 domain-containing protein [Sulfitobacter sp. SK012]|uniref:lipid A-modifier LpxR family protein n=1 Tax=Sulfitobacter sp. SK012 TaxID=1389005 RepID=UPI000E0C095A|nr:lipid A-modifier LpxR family protein [Sulfitobacter sp. SK012]AXI47790.1 DUF2219 domain-containing protein [Sulfitobacter sp. SK012]